MSIREKEEGWLLPDVEHTVEAEMQEKRAGFQTR